MLGLGLINKPKIDIGAYLRIVTDDLKLYMPYKDKGGVIDFVGTGSCSFDGVNDYVSVADSADLSFGDGSNDSAFTISTWVKPTDATNFNIAFKDTEYQFYLNASDHLTLFLEDESSGHYEYAYYNSATSENTWTHVACTYNGVGGASANAGITLYVNGISVTTTLADTGTYVAMENSANALEIGKQSSNYADGSIKNVAIWNRALTATEVQNVMYKTYYELYGRLASGLVSWWTLEKTLTSTTTKDVHGSNDGTLGDGITAGTMPTFTSNIYGGAVPVKPRAVDNSPKVQADAIGTGSALFGGDGTNDVITVGDDNSLDITDSISICFWAKPTGHANDKGIIDKGFSSDTPGQYAVILDASNPPKPQFYLNDADFNIKYNTGIPVDEWSHVACTYDKDAGGSNEAKIYVNGVLVVEGDYSTAMTSNAIDLYIGQYKTLNAYEMEGNIAQLGIWSSALTQAQIQSVQEKQFSELTASEKTNLVSYWALDEANGKIVSDKIDDTSLGSELVSNGDFSTDSTGWYDDNNDTFEVTGGELHAITSGTIFDGVRFQLPSVVSGKIYKIQFDYRVVGSSMTFYIFDNDTGTSGNSDSNGTASTTLSATSTTTQTIYWQCTASNSNARLCFVNGGSASREIYIDNVSCKLFGTDGNHGVLI